jgi:hypothetical protein
MTIPVKTALGQEELKSRAHRLGQRHRTVLLLVDGRRPLSEVLSLAQQAGSATSHFEDLVRLGLVDVPADPEPAAERAAAATPPAPAPAPAEELPQVTEVQFDVPAPEAASGDAVEAETAPSEPAEAEAHSEAHSEAGIVTPAAAPRPVIAQPEAPAVEASELPQVRLPETPPVRLPEAPPVGLPEAPPAAARAEADALQPVRNLLIETLRIDAPLFSARMFVRVRNARTAADLIELIWEIQEHLTRARRAQRELQSLQRARELLGLGNTVVAEDSTRPSHLDE